MTELTFEPIKLGKPVFVVEDDSAFRDELCTMLQDFGLIVEAADSASRAVRVMQEKPWTWQPAMIFTDIVMDGMGGYEFIRRVGSLFPKREIPIVVISRLSTGIDVGEAEVAGAAAYITKPCDREDVYESIISILERQKSGMLLFRRGSKSNLRRVTTTDAIRAARLKHGPA